MVNRTLCWRSYKKLFMIKLSVITPIYSTEEYLEQCLKSLIAQSLEGLELIWIDNGASEECKEIIKKYQNLRQGILVISLPENIGYCGAMNEGLNAAGGAYIGFCDSDDWVGEDYFAKLYSAAKNNDADIAYAQYIEHQGESTRLVVHTTSNHRLTNFCEKFSVVRHGAVWDKIFKRSLVTKHGARFLTSHISYYQDTVFMVRALIPAQDVVLVQDAYYHYRIVPTSTIRNASTTRARQEYSIELAGTLFQFINQYTLSQKEKECYFKFVARAFSLPYIIKKNKYLIQKIKELKGVDEFFMAELLRIHKAYHPRMIQRLFSIHTFDLGYLVYFLGFKVTLKNKGHD